MRTKTATLRQMRPDGIDSNLFSYHIHYLKTNGIIESVTRGEYQLTANGMYVVGKFNSATGNEAQDVKSVIVLLARRGSDVLLFRWSRHPYFGQLTLPHDRYNFGMTVQQAVTEAVQDKLHLSYEQAQARYLKSGMIHILHDEQQISCMSAHVYEVNYDGGPLTTRNGELEWVPVDSVGTQSNAMKGLSELIHQLTSVDIRLFEATLTY